MNKMPIDYEKSIKNTVEKIADFYIDLLKKKAGKMSVDEYNRLMKAANSLVASEKRPDFYKNYGWMKFDFVDLFLLNPSVRTAVENFFGCVQEYKNRKNIVGSNYLDTEEKNLANAIKKVNIKFGNEFIATFKDLFVKPEHYLSYSSSK